VYLSKRRTDSTSLVYDPFLQFLSNLKKIMLRVDQKISEILSRLRFCSTKYIKFTDQNISKNKAISFISVFGICQDTINGCEIKLSRTTQIETINSYLKNSFKLYHFFRYNTKY